MQYRILKMIATGGCLAALDCTKFVFRWALPQTTLGAPDLLAGLRGTYVGLLLRGREGEGKKKGMGM